MREWRLKEKFRQHPTRPRKDIIADGRRRFMNMKLIVAILVTTAMPVQLALAEDLLSERKRT